MTSSAADEIPPTDQDGPGGLTFFGGLSQFGIAILGVIVIPLFPLFIERFDTGHLAEASLIIIACIYCATVAIGTRFRWLTYWGLFLAMVESIFYDRSLSAKQFSDRAVVVWQVPPLEVSHSSAAYLPPQALSLIGALTILIICERCYRHVIKRQAFG